MNNQQYDTLTGLAFKLAEIVEDVSPDGDFCALVEEALPKDWQIEWFDCESDEDDLQRKELLVERDISRRKKEHEVFSFAWHDSGFRYKSHIIIGAPSFTAVKEFLEQLIKHN
jgi:hypothetical protein